MLIFTSPAKSLDFSDDWKADQTTTPIFQKQANQIAQQLASYSEKELGKVLGISLKLATLNYSRFQDWGTQPQKPAILAYTGDVYKQLNPNTYTSSQQSYLQNILRILTGLYGVLRPYDMMEAYRLEMGTKLSVGKADNLYQFWKDHLTKQLVSEIQSQNHTLVLNLASQEYSKAVDFSQFSVPVKEVIFKQERRGQSKTYGILAKKARGQMIEYCVQNNITQLEQVKKFAVDGYTFTDESEQSVTFVLPERS